MQIDRLVRVTRFDDFANSAVSDPVKAPTARIYPLPANQAKERYRCACLDFCFTWLRQGGPRGDHFLTHPEFVNFSWIAPTWFQTPLSTCVFRYPLPSKTVHMKSVKQHRCSAKDWSSLAALDPLQLIILLGSSRDHGENRVWRVESLGQACIVTAGYRYLTPCIKTTHSFMTRRANDRVRAVNSLSLRGRPSCPKLTRRVIPSCMQLWRHEGWLAWFTLASIE